MMGKDNKVLIGKFMNAFTSTTGFEEYSKFLAGEKLNEDRLVVTPDKVYQLGNAESADGGFKGYGGREFYLYGLDGSIERTSDLWYLKDREEEAVTLVKVENVYSPRDSINMLGCLDKINEFKDAGKSIYYLLLPQRITQIITDQKKIWEKEELLGKLRDMVFSPRYNMGNQNEVCLRNLINHIEVTTFDIFIIPPYHDSLEEDEQLLQLVISGSFDVEAYRKILSESRLQENMDCFYGIIGSLKQWYVRTYSDQQPKGFAEYIMTLRHNIYDSIK